MPESTVFVLDTSEHMRNGDYEPTRLEAQHQAARMMVDIKLSGSPENTVGFVSSGPTVVVRAPTTNDAAMLSSAVDGLKPAGKADFVAAVKTASLALHNRANKAGTAKVVAFVGSPVTASDKELKKMAAGIRKLNVAVDVVIIGEQDSSLSKLEAFVAALNANRNNCSLVSVPVKSNLTDVMMSSMFSTGGGGGGGGDSGAAAAAAAAAGGGAGGGGSSEEDMIAMAMRQSLAMAQEATAGATTHGGGSGGEAAGVTAAGGGGGHGGLPADINVALLEANGIDLTLDVEMLRVMQASLNEAFGISDETPANPEGSPRAEADSSSATGTAGASVPSPGGGDAEAEAAGGGSDTAGEGDGEDGEDGGFDEAAMMAMMEGLDASDPEIAASLQAILEAQQEQRDGDDDDDEDTPASGGDSSAKRPKPDGSE